MTIYVHSYSSVPESGEQYLHELVTRTEVESIKFEQQVERQQKTNMGYIYIKHIPTFLGFALVFLFLFKLKRFDKVERFVLGVLLIRNVSYLVHEILKHNGIYFLDFHTYVHVIEISWTFRIYALNCISQTQKKLNYLGIVLFVSLSLMKAFAPTGGNYYDVGLGKLSFVLTSFLIAVLSYLHLRAISIGLAKPTFLISVLGFANLFFCISFTFLISFMQPLFHISYLQEGWATQIVMTLGIALSSLWEITLIIGVLWYRRIT